MMKDTSNSWKTDSKKLKVGLIVHSTISSKYLYELAEWGQRQSNLVISHLVKQEITITEENTFQKLLSAIRDNGFKYMARHVGLRGIEKLESTITKYIRTYKNHKTYKYHFKKYNLLDYIKTVISIKPIVDKDTCEYWYDDNEIRKVTDLELDILVRCGSEILRGEILNSTRFGIISIHHADDETNRSGPPAFWEVYLKQDSTGFTIQQITEEIDSRKVLFQGQIPTKFFYTLNQVEIKEKSYYYLKKILSDVSDARALPKNLDTFPCFKPISEIPSLRIQFFYVFYFFFSLMRKFLGKLILRKWYRWGVCFSFEDWRNLVMCNSVRIKSAPYHFLADPFVVSFQNNNYCFLEEFDFRNSKGSISVYRIFNNGYERIGQVIEEDFHMSYPYVFEYESKYYMCPETSQNKDVRLYECEDFPLKWKLKKVMLSDISAAETMIFEKDGIWWLFTNVDPLEMGDHSSEFRVYFSNNPLTNTWIPHKKNPIFVDSARARNGGILFDGEAVFRISQQHGFDMYGKTFSINKIVQLTKSDYEEECIFKVEPYFFKGLCGTHHLHSNGKVTVFDYVEMSRVDV